MKYRNSARTLALVIAGLLACPPVSAQAVTFADMNNVPWPGAEVSINKAAELGLVVGETINGKSYFKPKDPVSLTQSCQLAYKLLTETGKATADASLVQKWSTVMNTYKIQSWAHPAVSFCLEKGIVTISDLSGFVSGEVNKPATREQAAEILGRALTVGVPSKTANATSTSFKDNASISKDAIPYIALLNAEKIVNGDDVGKFNPKNTLNRTETAVMVTNLYNVLKNATTVVKPTSLGSQSGTINDMNNLYVNLAENANAYFLFASTGATVTLNGSASTVANVLTLFKDGETIKVTLTLDSNNRITKMAATYEATVKAEKATEGIITKITYDDEDGDGRLEINDTSSYFVRDADDVAIEITDEDGDETDYYWEDLVELFEECEDNGTLIEIKLTLYPDGDIRRITGEIVEDEDGQSDGDLKGDKVGKITDLDYDDDDDSGEIKLGNTKYYIDDVTDIDIEIDGDDADWDDLWDLYEEYEEDDEDLRAAIDLDDDDRDYVTDIRVSTKESSNKNSSSGDVSSVTFNEDKEEGTIKIGSDTYKAPETDDVEVDIKDGDSEITTWEELYNAYKDGKTMDLEVEVDGKEVTEVSGKVTKAKGYLDSFGDDYLKLEGKKSGDSSKYYFTEYDRDDDEDDWEEALEKISVSGIKNVSNLLEFFEDWLDDENLDLGTDDDEDCFELTMELDSKGYIKKISGTYK